MSRIDPPATVDWFDVDLPDVIALREAMMPVRENAHPVGASLLDPQWTQAVPADRPTILVADGLLGFLSEAEVTNLLRSITEHCTAGDLQSVVEGTARARARH